MWCLQMDLEGAVQGNEGYKALSLGNQLWLCFDKTLLKMCMPFKFPSDMDQWVQ